MKRNSRSPAEDSLVGTILVENIPRRLVSNGDIFAWMKKYGNISEISIYKDCFVIQFESDLEAAGAVQCENGAQFFGTTVSVKHAEPGILSALRRSGPPVNQFSANPRRVSSSLNPRDRKRERDRDRDRNRFRDRDRDRGKARELDSPPRGRHYESTSPYDRRRRRDDRSPRRRSRSPVSARGDRRHVHPLNWLSEMAGTDSLGSTKSISGTSPNRNSHACSPPPPPPYTVAIVAVQHDLVPYAETIEKRVSTGIRGLGGRELTTPLRTHIVVLLSAEHLTPCLADLTRDRVPFAIICTTTNWSHGSCTVRILYVPAQQEHRNMPLDDAMTLLQKEYEAYLALDKTSSLGSAAPVVEENVGEDHTFLAPSRNMITLLRMLADSRILSIGELDEIAAFVQERKRRLEGRRLDGNSADSRNGNTSDLKSRILSMLYPPTTNSSTAPSNTTRTHNPTTEQSNPVPNASLDANSLQTINRLAGALPNPAIQQAIDTLMLIPPDRIPQPVPAPSSSSTMSAASLMQQSNFGKGASFNMNQERPSGPAPGSNRLSFGSTTGSTKTGRSEMNSSHRNEDHMRHGFGSQKHSTDYQNSVQASTEGLPMYKQPMPQQQTTYGNEPHFKGSQDSRGSTGGASQRESDETYPGPRNSGPGLLRQKDDQYCGPNIRGSENEVLPTNVPPWQRRKKGKRGGGTKSVGDANQRGAHSKMTGNRNPSDLMATAVAPVGAIADAYQYGWTSGYGSGSLSDHPGPYPSSGSQVPSLMAQYPYPTQSYGHPYPQQPYY